jgi:plastocyanin
MNILTPQNTLRQLSALGKLTATTLASIAAIFIAMQAFVIGLDPMLSGFSVALLIVAGIVAIGWRWAPALGTLLALLLIVGLLAPALDPIIAEITTPGMPLRVPLTILLPLLAIGVLAGIAATVQNYRRAPAERHAPPWLFTTLVGVAGVIAGALLLGSVIKVGTSAGVSPQVLASLPAVTTKDHAFAQAELRVRVGEMAAFRLENADGVPHSFDIDELGVHAPIMIDEQGVALFKPTTPGTYTFYCAPHYDKQTGEGMKGTLVVES